MVASHQFRLYLFYKIQPQRAMTVYELHLNHFLQLMMMFIALVVVSEHIFPFLILYSLLLYLSYHRSHPYHKFPQVL